MMKRKLILVRVWLTAFAGLISTAAVGQQETRSLHPVAPLVNPTTIAIADLNLERLHVDACVRFLDGVFGSSEQSPAELFAQIVPELKELGVKKAHVLFSTQTLVKGGPTIFIAKTDPSKIQRAVPMLRARTIGDGVLLGTEMGLKQYSDLEASDPTPDHADRLTVPLRDRDDDRHRLVLATTADYRNMLASMWPAKTAKGFPVSFSPKQLAQDVHRIIIDFQLPPNVQAVVRLETENEQACDRVAKLGEQAVALISKNFGGAELRKGKNEIIIQTTENWQKRIESLLVSSRASALEASRINSLKQIGLGIHIYHDQMKHVPPRCYIDLDGKPIHSWRTAILSQVDQQSLLNGIDLAKPWDRQPKDNVVAINTIPICYTTHPTRGPMTTFRAPSLPGSLWHGEGPPRSFDDVIDGLSNTIAVVEAPEDAAVHWADPAPWVLDEENLVEQVFGDRDSTHALFLDGSVRRLTKSDVTAKQLKAFFTIAGRD